MTWVVPLALGGVAILVMAVFAMLSARKRHRAIVAPATTAGPRVLVHDINDDRCTGCDACVSVCPTNVLDLVSNKSRVLRFGDCIQCEACMFACPTEALVMFPEGGVPPVLKVPEIDENFQTAIPGQYLIGEVAGKPLVKNAANLGRSVIEHMLLNGLVAGALGKGENVVDVAIIGSGPGGLSTALTCIQRGLSYVVLEKEQTIASTISRYPKGKLVMGEPYETQNMSFLPVFDSGKEQLIALWKEVIERVGLTIKQGESVETVTRASDGTFEVKTTVASYKAQRAVLSIGTRGKPRTLQVPGENLPKVYSLLEDPDDWRGKSVLIVGGGDSACEAAMALADAGAKVIISYRGKGFNRAAPKNKTAIEAAAAAGKLKAKLGSQVLNFDAESVTMSLADGSQKKYPNDACFVLIGADPPISWLEKVGVKFVERPHQYQLGKTDDMVRRFVPNAVECPEDAARAAALILGGSLGVEPAPASSAAMTTTALPMPMGEPMSGPRKWLRSATSIFSNRGVTASGIMPILEPASKNGGGGGAARGKKFDAPVPLSEFAKRGKTNIHSHNGRRDALSAGERTRILRMLRDEGGRIADEESQVYIGSAPGGRGGGGNAGNNYDFDYDEASRPGLPPAAVLPDVPAKPAVVVGLAQAQAQAGRGSTKRSPGVPAQPRPTAQQFAAPRSRPTSPPPPIQQQLEPRQQAPMQLPPEPPMQQAPLHLSSQPPMQQAPMQLPPEPVAAPPPPPRPRVLNVPPPPPQPQGQARRQVPPTFNEEPTRQASDQMLEALRNAAPAKAAPRKNGSRVGPIPEPPKPSHVRAAHDEPTRMANMAQFGFASAPPADAAPEMPEEAVRPARTRQVPPPPPMPSTFEDNRDNEDATRVGNFDAMAIERARNGQPNGQPTSQPNDERTRAVNIRDDPSFSNIDWDLD